MSADIIDFQSPSIRRVRTEPAEPFAPRVTGRQRAGRKRNPLRYPCTRVDYAVTIAGKLQRNEPLTDGIDEIAALRRGVEAARFLAEELERLVNRHGWRVQPPATEVVDVPQADDKPTSASQGIDDRNLEALIDRLLKARGL